MKRTRAGLVAAACAASVVAIGAGGAPASASAQCTQQYIVWVDDANLRYSPGGANNGVVAHFGEKFNVQQKDGSWYDGNLYGQYGGFLGSGWILAADLNYNTCF